MKINFITSPMRKLHKTLLSSSSKPKKTRSITRNESNQSSFSSSTSINGSTTPKSVLPASTSFSSSSPVDVAAHHHELIQAFHMIDSDGDGKLTKQELHTLLYRLGTAISSSEYYPNLQIDEEDLKLMVDEADADGDGCITSDEFCSAIGSAFTPPACDAEVREAFDFFDSNGDGKITAEELYEAFRVINNGNDDKCTLEDCKRMIGGVDSNGLGFVCLDDFKTMMEVNSHVLVR